ncbi:MAG: ABC-2 family transporter protein [Candidatus Schekmanbacteria bacterium]|nr:ABC-2 family transporter protein [Candidatus Schekmanbacteria bacterium]
MKNTSWLARLARVVAATRVAYGQAISVELSYRFALAQSFFGIAISLAGLLLFWLAAARAAVSPTYPEHLIVGYFTLTAVHRILHENRVSFNVSASIRLGKLSAAMLRPYPFLLTVMAQAAAHATVRIAIIAPILIALAAALDPLAKIARTVGWQELALYTLALLLSFAAGWLIQITVGLLAFQMTQTWGPDLIFHSIYAVASGGVYPPDLLPPFWHALAAWTPVYYMIAFPALVLLGRVQGAELCAGLVRGAIVTAVTAAVVTVMWRRGIRRFEAIGI